MKQSDLLDFAQEICDEATKASGRSVVPSIHTESEDLGIFRVQLMVRPSEPRMIGGAKGFRWALDPDSPVESLELLKSYLTSVLEVDVCVTCKRPL